MGTGDSLTEHGLDFVEEAVVRLLEQEGDDRAARYAVLHLAIGAELLLKARLFREHWALVFEKPEKATPQALASGDFKSAGPEDAVERLKNICGVEFGACEKAMADLRRARNKVVHFAVPLPEPALRSQAAKVLTGLVDFIDEQLELKDGSADMEARRRILEALREFNVYLDERRADIAERVKALGTYVFSCPLCHEVAMTATQEDGLTCLFCKGDVALEEAVEWQAENELGYSAYEAAKEGQPFPAARCPRCEERTFMRIRDNSEQRVCFNCGARFAPKELESCVECGRFFVVTSEDDGVICDDCFEQKTAED